MTEFYYYEPRHGHGLDHDPLNAIIAPRPIGWISTKGCDGHNGLAPYCFFNAFNHRPPIVGFASIGWKDTITNVETTGEFAWNLVTRSLATAMNATAEAVLSDVDEFLLGGVSPAPSRLICAPRVAESPVSFECRLSQLIPLADSAGQDLDTWLVLGEVVAVHIRQDLIASGTYDTLAADPILRAGGLSDYFWLEPSTRFQMPRHGH